MNLIKRIIVAIILIPAVIYIILKSGDPYNNQYYRAMIMLILSAAAYEFIYSHKKNVGIINKIMTIAALMLLVNSDLNYNLYIPLFSFMVMIIITLNFLTQTPKDFYEKTKLMFFTIVYLGAFGLNFNLLARIDSFNGYSGYLVLLAISLNWICDSGAYFTGRLIGKRKLAPVLSPNKTIEGFIGGCFTAIIYSLIYRHFLLSAISLKEMVLLSFLLAVICSLGDLCASAIKRASEIKDYSNIIPGHGGIMDRIDSVLYTAAFTVIYFNLKEKILI